MSSDILSTNFNKNQNVQTVKRYCIVDANNSDEHRYNQSPAEKLITNELQIDVQFDNKLKDKSSIERPLMGEGIGEDQVKEVVGHQLRFSVHGKRNDENNDNDLSVQPEYDATIDDRLPETVTLLTTSEGGKLYLIGTAHFSVESQNDVATIIQAVQPHIVVIELCKARIDVINFNEEALYRNAANLSFRNLTELLKEYGAYNGLLHFVLYRLVAYVVKQLEMPPGGEFRTAFEEAKKIPNCVIQLADRSINVTFQRMLRELSWWEIIKLMWLVVKMDARISKQDVERYKRKDVIDQMISTLREQYPAIERAFVTERDVYLTYHLQMAIMSRLTQEGLKPPRVVGVVGIGHINGIVENWGKVKASDIWPIMRVPPQPLSSKILKFTIKATVLGAVLYVGYKIVPLPSSSTLQTIKSSFEGLLKILVSMEATACPDEYEHTVSSVMYIVHNIPGPGIDLEEFESEYSVRCSCTVQCSNSSCSCIRDSLNYIDDRILDDKLSGPIIECNSRCTCKENCGNRVVQKGPLDSLIVSQIDKKGLGLFTTKRIKKGQFICEYAGEVIGIEEARRRTEANKNSMNYVLVVSEHIEDRVIVTCIDPKFFGNIGRYANHSCEPNTNLVPIRVEGPVPRLCLFACRDIEISEEITFNYAGGVANSIHNLSDTPCLCGSDNCSGYLPHNSI